MLRQTGFFMSDSIGKVKAQKVTLKGKFELECGQSFNDIELVYETYGVLNADATNAILICHALSGNHHAAGKYENEEKPGWWDSLIGPGKAVDTNKFFVVCPNNIGGCHGSLGPNSINHDTGDYYGPDFPIITVRDWVNSQAKLSDLLGIEKWHAVMGGSLGGMQALEWSYLYPRRIKKAGIIAAAPKLSAQNIAFNEVARQAILNDPDFEGGRYLDKNKYPKQGLKLARMVGHITYLSEEAMRSKFGRELKKEKLNFGYDAEFEIESYLRYQGDVFSESFDANTYLLMTKALDYFDPFNEIDFVERMSKSRSRFLVISFTSDWRFPPKRSEEIVKTLIKFNKDVSYACIKSDGGHDAFLMKNDNYFEIMRTYIEANING